MITVIRPGEKEGQLLSGKAEQEALELGSSFNAAEVFCSSSPRAIQTARCMLQNSKAPRVLEELEFSPNLETEYGQELRKSFQEKRFTRFLVEESDALASKLGDDGNFRYSTIVDQMMGIIERLQNLPGNQVVIAHTGFGECLLTSIIRSSGDSDHVESFLRSLSDFEFKSLEGFEIDDSVVRYQQKYSPFFTGEWYLPSN